MLPILAPIIIAQAQPEPMFDPMEYYLVGQLMGTYICDAYQAGLKTKEGVFTYAATRSYEKAPESIPKIFKEVSEAGGESIQSQNYNEGVNTIVSKFCPQVYDYK